MAHNDYDEVRKFMRGEATKGRDKESIAWDAVEGVAAVIDEFAFGFVGQAVSIVRSGSNTIRNFLRGKKGNSLVPNPWFVTNGHTGDNDDNKYTETYFKKIKKRKKLKSKIAKSVGNITSTFTQVDVANSAIHGHAVLCSVSHLQKLRAIAQKYGQSKTILAWFDVLIKMKSAEATSNGIALAGAAIPIGAVGTATSVAGTVLNTGVKLTMTKACLYTAADLHWRAYQEQSLTNLFNRRVDKGVDKKQTKVNSGKAGPASKMIYELFRQPGVLGSEKLSTQFEADKIINNPAGWLAVNQKLMYMN